jgi:hypothetical protein
MNIADTPSPNSDLTTPNGRFTQHCPNETSYRPFDALTERVAPLDEVSFFMFDTY